MTSGEVVQLVTALIWPVVVVLLAFAYRKPLGRLLNRLSSLEAAGVKGEFNAPAEKVLDEAELVTGKGDTPDATGDTTTLKLINLTATQPWWSVHQAWRLVVLC
jgi:hypothetical protein